MANESIIATMAAQEQAEEQLLQLSNVIGVGTGLRVKGGRITRETLEHLLAFSSRLTAGAPELRQKLSAVKQVATAVEGMRLGNVLRSAELILGARARTTRKSRSRRR